MADMFLVRRVRRGRRRAFGGVIGLASLLALTCASCGGSTNSISEQAKLGTQKGYVSGDGRIEQIPPSKRGKALNLAGHTLTGRAWSLTDERGQVVVLNTWASWCPPCVEEVPDLQRTWAKIQHANQPVQFMGINLRESAQTAHAFLRSRNVTYPSLARDGGQTVLALRGLAPDTPTTLVIDQHGRVAARVLGPVTSTTLAALLTDVLATNARHPSPT